jgi:hypothetical protein
MRGYPGLPINFEVASARLAVARIGSGTPPFYDQSPIHRLDWLVVNCYGLYGGDS